MATPFGDGSFIIGTVARIYYIQASINDALADLNFSDQITGSNSITSRFGSPVFAGSQLAHTYLYPGGGTAIPVFTHIPGTTGYKMIRKCPNYWDYCLREERRLIQRGTICGPQVPWFVGHLHDQNAEHVMPGTCQEIYKIGVVPVDFAADNAVIVEFTLPFGYEGLLYSCFQRFTGTGLVPGSGSLVWRVQVGQRYPKDMGNMPWELGEHASYFPLADYIRLVPHQHVAYRYSAAADSGDVLGTGNVIAAVQGWIWPTGTNFAPPRGKALSDRYATTGNKRRIL